MSGLPLKLGEINFEDAIIFRPVIAAATDGEILRVRHGSAKSRISPILVLDIPNLIFCQSAAKASFEHCYNPSKSQAAQNGLQDEENLDVLVLLSTSHCRR